MSTTDIDPDNAVEEVLEMLENEDEEQEEENDDTNEHLDDPVEDEETSEEVDASGNEFFERVSKMNIKEDTRNGYNSSNRLFLLWLDDKHPECVANFAKTALQETFESRRIFGATVKHQNKSVTAKALELVASATSSESAPIIFDKITSEIFLNFLRYRANLRGNEFLSKSGAGGFRSAFRELHKQCGAEFDPVFESKLKELYKGLLRGHADEKQKKGGRLAEGKDPMSFRLYKTLCNLMTKDSSKEAIFAHAFLTLTWNLICRSKNTVHIHMNHITWGADAMIIKFAHTKTDVAGENKAYSRHIYANPFDPDICAITALAKYLSCFPPKADGMLFDKKSYKRFQKYLKDIVSKNKDDIERMGYNIDDIGVHSIRKGAATFCCSGTTEAPHIASICNRAGWTMGKVKDVYIKYGAAGDQYVGRVVAGLPTQRANFACSHPVFNNTVSLDDIDYVIATFFPTFQEKVTFKPVAVSCAAALLYSYDYFDKTVESNSCFRASSALFTIDRDSRLLEIQHATTIVHAWEDDSPHFDLANLTGIPVHVTNLVEHQKTKKIIDSNFADMRNYVRDELDKRQMGGGMTFELIEERISGPILEKLANVQASLEKRDSSRAPENEPRVMPQFQWASDNAPIPRLLPEDYILPTKIHPFAMWKQWHHGVSFKDGIAVGPLKNIPNLNCPEKYKRRFALMKKFYLEFDRTAGVSGNESIAELGELYDKNHAKWKELGILLPEKTPTNRSRNRNENGWFHIANQWERLLKLRDESATTGVPLDDLVNAANEKERLRQKRYREKKKAEKEAAKANENANVTVARPARRRRRINSRRDFSVSADVARGLDTLLH